MTERPMKFIELFAGIGGMRYGLERCMGTQCTNEKSEQTESEVQFGGQRPSVEVERGVLPTDLRRERSVYSCVWANEIDKYACQIYRKNYWEGELYEGDITKVKASDIPDHDLLVCGFPCQAFSIAGKRRGFDDIRGTLFFEIARICRAKKPRYILLENVKGLLSHDKGNTFSTILEVLADIGYILQWEVLNSKNYSVPQNRERVFIVGHLRGTCRPEVFPIGEDGEIPNEKQCSKTRGLQTTNQEGQDKLHTNKQILEDGENRPFHIRRLTPTECERLQGFPDGWTEGGLTQEGNSVTISDTQRYKTLGNAITCSVVTEIGRRLL